LRKFFKNAGFASGRDSFSYVSSSFNFWESEISAANGRKKKVKTIKKRKTEKNSYSPGLFPNLLAEPEKARTPTFIAFGDILDILDTDEEASETRIPATRRAGPMRVA
jgi:hypothetical protein